MQDEQSLKFSFLNFIGGINQSLDESLINVNEASYAQNCKIDDGNLSTIPGCTEYKFNDTCPVNITTIMCFYNLENNGLLVAGDGKIYHYKDNTWTLIKNELQSDVFDYVNFQINNDDVIVFGNGIDNTMVYNGSGSSGVRNLLNRYIYTDTTEGIEYLYDASGTLVEQATLPSHVDRYSHLITTLAPKAKFLELHYDRLFVASKDTIYFSAATRDGFDIDDWCYPTTPESEVNQHGGFIDIKTWDSGHIVGMKKVFNNIVVFKNRTVHEVYGTYPGNFSVSQIFTTTGAIADKSIVQGENAVYFVAKEGIFVYNGSSVTRISDKIKDIWDNLNFDKDINGNYYLSNATGAWYEGKYYIAVTEKDFILNNLLIEYNPKNNSFMVLRGRMIASFIEFQDKILYSDKQFHKVYEFGVGDNFDGRPIFSSYETGTIFSDSLEAVKSTDYIYILAKGSGTITISCTADYENTTSINLILTPEYKVHKIKFKCKGRVFKFKIENIMGSIFTIKKIKFPFDYDED